MKILEEIDEKFRTEGNAGAEAFMLRKRDEFAADEEAHRNDLIAVLNELGGYYRDASRFTESIENFEHAFALMDEQNVQYAIMRINEAGAYRLSGRTGEAIRCFEDARLVLKANGEEDGYEYATLLNNMSLLYQDEGRLDVAVECAGKAYAIVHILKEGCSEEAVSLINLASLSLATDDIDQAEECVDLALKIYDNLGKPTGHYPAAVDLKAVVNYRRGAFAEAAEGFMRAADLTSRIFGKNLDYVSALNNAAMAYDAAGDDASAKQAREKAEETRKTIG